MPQINLTTLSGQELRQRLDSSRARGDAALAYEILREMAARRSAEAGRRPLLKRRAAEPRVVDVDLDDPLDRNDDLPAMPHWRAPKPLSAEAAPLPEPEPEPQPEPESDPESEAQPRFGLASPRTHAAPLPELARPTDVEALPHFRPLEPPLTLVDPEPPPGPAPEPADLRMPPAEAESPRPRTGHGLRVAAGFAVGITSGVALGWFAAGLAPDAPPRIAAPLEVSSPAVQSPGPAMLEVVAEPAPPADPPPPVELAEAPTPTDLEAPAQAPPAAVEVAERPDLEAPAPVANACAAEPTPADREICADPALQRLQRSLRRAYAEALDAHEDRALLRARQLAWRDARSDVSDPVQLSRLYEQRIQKLQAAAAEARSLR